MKILAALYIVAMSFLLASAQVVSAAGEKTVAKPPAAERQLIRPGGIPGSPGLNRYVGEEPRQCQTRVLGYEERARNIEDCVRSCMSCYTTSGGTGCRPYCARRYPR